MSLSKQPASARIFACLAALSITVCLAGCTNDDDVQLDDTTDASEVDPTEYIPASAEGPAQNVPEPNLPAVATENTEEGAKATLEYFWEAEAYASLTGETDAMSLIATEECDFCMESINDWKQSYDKGSWAALNGDIETEISDSQTDIDENSNKQIAHIFFQLQEPATDFYSEEGEPIDSSFESPVTSDWFALLFFDATAQRWKIEWIGLEESITWE